MTTDTGTLEKLRKLEAKVEAAKTLKIRAETSQEEIERRLAKLEEESLNRLGVSLSELHTMQAELEDNAKGLLQEAESLIEKLPEDARKAIDDAE